MVHVHRVIMSPKVKIIGIIIIQMEEVLITRPTKQESGACVLNSPKSRGMTSLPIYRSQSW
jgi:hypothetical protein